MTKNSKEFNLWSFSEVDTPNAAGAQTQSCPKDGCVQAGCTATSCTQNGCLSTLYSNYNRISSEKMYLNIINEFLNKGICIDLSFFDKSKSYAKYNRAFGNCCNVVESCNNTLLSVITSIIQILMISSVLIWANIYIFLAILFFIIINITINNVLKKHDYDFNVALSEKNKQVNYLYRLFYTPQFIRDIKVNAIDKFVLT